MHTEWWLRERALATIRNPSTHLGAFIGFGAISGTLSALVFSIIHYFLISPIWFALVANLVAGAVSGACLAWSYALAVDEMRGKPWVIYNLSFVLILVALAGTSLLMFDPVTTIPALLQAKGPPRALIGQAFPVTLVFTLASAVILSLRYRARWAASAAIGVTAVVIVLFLGLNLSVLGLVHVPRGSLYLLFEVLALILALALVYTGTMMKFWRRTYREATIDEQGT